MKVLVSYASPSFAAYRDRLVDSARRFGIGQSILYGRSDIRRTAFYESCRTILDRERGDGCWAWKPYIILDALQKTEEGSFVIYSDADSEFIRPLDPLLHQILTRGEIGLFRSGSFLNRRYTKRDTFVFMDCDRPEYWNNFQVWAGFMVVRNSPRSRAFMEEWLQGCQDERIVTDAPNVSGYANFPDFVDHRFDQSVLSLLAVKHRLPVFAEIQLDYIAPDLKWRR